MSRNFIGGPELKGTVPAVFVSTLQTGTGNPQNVAHTLGYTPTVVIAVWQGTGTWTVAYGTHTSTNVVLTAANTATFFVMAW